MADCICELLCKLKSMINQYDWASKWAVVSPQKIAFKEFETGRTINFLDLNRMGNRLAHQLTKQYQVKKGDRIALLSENCLEHIILLVAAQKTGCILVPMNYRLASEELDYLLNNSTPQVAIVESIFQDKIDAATAYQRIPFTLSLEEVKTSCDTTIHELEDAHFEQVPLQPDDPLFILYTSGTTGFPKGSLYTHQMLFWNSLNTSLSLRITSASRTVTCMPPFHTGGWNILLSPIFHYGGYTCIMKNFEATSVLQAISQEQATIFMGVPTMLKMMADTAYFRGADVSSMHYFVAGGEPMPIPLIEKWHKKGVPIRQGFGMTEAGPNLTSLHQQDAIRKKGSIGRPNFYVQTKIVDAQNNPCPPDQAGELLLKGPMVTPGYWGNPTATEQAFIDGWFRTGDRVVLDQEGYLFVVDRIKNMYISGGENVYPAEVERVLLSYSAISEVVIIGVPDEKWGEVGKAFIVKKEAVTKEEILDFCRSKLAKYKIPNYIVFLEELPKNDTGKINRKVSKKDFA